MHITRSQIKILKELLDKTFPGNWHDYFYVAPIQYTAKSKIGKDEIRVTKAQTLLRDIEHGKAFAIRGQYGFYCDWKEQPSKPYKTGFLDTIKVFRLPPIIIGPCNDELYKYIDRKGAMKKVIALMNECDADLRLKTGS